uniref:Uncharacterized protein n=1 Tax=viral metagenome TaxID=1070528 RepID=A0A6C0DMD2_9ZZZZ
MIIDLYLSYNRKRRNEGIIDNICFIHFFFGYLLYVLKFPLLFTVFVDIFSQLLLRTKNGDKVLKYIFKDGFKKDDNLAYRYCDTLFIILGWFVGYLNRERVQ